MARTPSCSGSSRCPSCTTWSTSSSAWRDRPGAAAVERACLPRRRWRGLPRPVPLRAGRGPGLAGQLRPAQHRGRLAAPRPRRRDDRPRCRAGQARPGPRHPLTAARATGSTATGSTLNGAGPVHRRTGSVGPGVERRLSPLVLLRHAAGVTSDALGPALLEQQDRHDHAMSPGGQESDEVHPSTMARAASAGPRRRAHRSSSGHANGPPRIGDGPPCGTVPAVSDRSRSGPRPLPTCPRRGTRSALSVAVSLTVDAASLADAADVLRHVLGGGLDVLDERLALVLDRVDHLTGGHGPPCRRPG